MEKGKENRIHMTSREKGGEGASRGQIQSLGSQGGA